MYCDVTGAHCPSYHFCSAGYPDGRSICCHILGWLVMLVFYGPSTHFMSFRARSVNLTTLFLGNSPRQLTST